jgi:Lrp/AsnC family transcriptional regulator, leucine-responsive regulatory protein
MLKEKLGMDAKDLKILSLFMKNPHVSQTELAEALSISQPSVNARVHKLRKRGILSGNVGIEFNKTDMYLARVDFTAPDADSVMEQLKQCSFFVNGFIMSGKNNASIFIVAHDLRKLDAIINQHLRSNMSVKDINMSVAVSAAKPFVCSIDLEKEQHEECMDTTSCADCKIGKNHFHTQNPT